MSIVIFILVIAVLIFVHELGHFITAKKSGIRVDEFAIGFPPRIFSKKIGETIYTLNLIPFGGFVKIFGEDPHSDSISEENRKVSFYYKPRHIQALVLVSGIAFNIIFAWFLISTNFFLGTIAPLPHDTVGEYKDGRLIVTEVMPNSPAKNSGFRSGDTIISIESKNGKFTEKLFPEKILDVISKSDESVKFVLSDINGNSKEVNVLPVENTMLGRKIVGISMEWVGTLRLGFFDSIIAGGKSTFYLLTATVNGIFKFIWNIIIFKSDFSQVTGPVGIASVVKEATNLGIKYLISITAIISINLAVINLVPFPALDGGRLLFVLIESIIRKPISQRVVRISNTLGFVLLITLMVVVTTRDILKIF